MSTTRYYYLGLLVFFIVPKDKRAGGFATLAATPFLASIFSCTILPLDSGPRPSGRLCDTAITYHVRADDLPAYLLTRTPFSPTPASPKRRSWRKSREA
jgi:hypothetical protein